MSEWRHNPQLLQIVNNFKMELTCIANNKPYSPIAMSRRDRRKSLGLTQTQFAERTGYSTVTILSYEKGNAGKKATADLSEALDRLEQDALAAEIRSAAE